MAPSSACTCSVTDSQLCAYSPRPSQLTSLSFKSCTFTCKKPTRVCTLLNQFHRCNAELFSGTACTGYGKTEVFSASPLSCQEFDKPTLRMIHTLPCSFTSRTLLHFLLISTSPVPRSTDPTNRDMSLHDPFTT